MAWLPAMPAASHSNAGRVFPPAPAPALTLARHDGRRATLAAMLTGRATALQLMFTGCSSTCPLQGAQFAAVSGQLAALAGKHPTVGAAQLVSVTVDPLNDEPAAMRRWLRKFDAPPFWSGVTPQVHDLDRWLDFLKVRFTNNERHTAQVYYFDARGALVLRSVDFPKPEEVARSLLLLSSQS